MAFLRWLLLDVWTPANIRFNIVYGFFAQFKFLFEIILIISALYFLWFGHTPSRKLLLLIFVVIFILGVVFGDILIRFGIPQKIAEKNNKINPQIDKINEIAKKLGI